MVIPAIAAAAALYILSIKPNTSRKSELAPFESCYIAHRGLFGDKAPENSLEAFALAADFGFGIELDVQITADDKLVVFHDKTLERMCGDSRQMNKCTYAEISKMRLNGTDSVIPLLSDVLKLINGRVPLIVEVKPRGEFRRMIRPLDDLMQSYNGIYCVQSFHVSVLNWYRKHRSGILRGQLSTRYIKDGIKSPLAAAFIMTNLMANFITKPDFISYNFRYKNQPSYWLCRKLYAPKNAGWTIKSQSELGELPDFFTVKIFDGFVPK